LAELDAYAELDADVVPVWSCIRGESRGLDECISTAQFVVAVCLHYVFTQLDPNNGMATKVKKG